MIGWGIPSTSYPSQTSRPGPSHVCHTARTFIAEFFSVVTDNIFAMLASPVPSYGSALCRRKIGSDEDGKKYFCVHSVALFGLMSLVVNWLSVCFKSSCQWPFNFRWNRWSMEPKPRHIWSRFWLRLSWPQSSGLAENRLYPMSLAFSIWLFVTVRHGKIHPFLSSVYHLFRLGPSIPWLC